MKIQDNTALINLEGDCNARHLGGCVASGGLTRNLAVVQCGHPSLLTQGDLGALILLGLHTAIDLRTPEEVHREPSPFAEIPGLAYHLLPAVEAEETRRHNLLKMGQGERYLWMLENRGTVWSTACRLILGCSRGVILHSATGGERCTVLSALLLLSAGVEEETVLERLRQPDAWRGIRELREPRAPHGLAVALEHLRSAYGGAKGYLAHIGLTGAELARLEYRMVRKKETRHRFMTA